jgi:dihydroxyacetone kinase-like protein
MGKTCLGAPRIDGPLFLSMLENGERAVLSTGQANRGDKTMLDCLGPAVDALRESLEAGNSFREALDHLKSSATSGRDSTYDMLARVGRASRLGERSRGHIDAGAASCCTILYAMADGVSTRLHP